MKEVLLQGGVVLWGNPADEAATQTYACTIEILKRVVEEEQLYILEKEEHNYLLW